MWFLVAGPALFFLSYRFFYWLFSRLAERKDKRRMQSEIIHAMYERLLLDNEMLHAMKAMTHEAERYTSPTPPCFLRQRE